MSSIVVDEPMAVRADQVRRVRLGRKALIAAVACVVVVPVAVSLVLGRGGHLARPSGRWWPSGEASYNGLTLYFPASWHAVQPTFITGAMAYPLGWITNAQPGPQCTAGKRGHVGCHGPVTHLGSGVVQIAVLSAGLFPAPDLAVNARLGGFPAHRTDSTTGCDPSAVSGFSIVATETPASGVRLTACFGPNTTAQQDQVQQILDTASYWHL